MLAHRLGLCNAPPAPSRYPLDPASPETYIPVNLRAPARMRDGSRPGPGGGREPAWRPPRRAWVLFRRTHRSAGGRARVARAMEPA